MDVDKDSGQILYMWPRWMRQDMRLKEAFTHICDKYQKSRAAAQYYVCIHTECPRVDLVRLRTLKHYHNGTGRFLVCMDVYLYLMIT